MILTFLSISFFFSLVDTREKRKYNGNDSILGVDCLKQRIIFGALAVVVTVALFVICVETRVLFLAVCAVLGGREMAMAIRKCGYNPRLWPVFALCAASASLMYFGLDKLVVPAFVLVLIALFVQTVLTGHPPVRDVFSTMAVCAYPVTPILLCVRVALNPVLWAPVFLNALASAILSDTFALFGGMRFGRHKLCPAISPNKTVEGLACGLAAGTLSAFPVHWVLRLFGLGVIPLWGELVCALLASLAGALGDLAASCVKREAKIKDYSHLIPGHGGILDRVDSAIFAIPVVYMVYAILV